MQEGFLQHRTAWISWQGKVAAVEEIGRDVKAALKADGYTVKQMQIADQLAGKAKAEAKVVAEVKDRLQVARWIGHPMGAQLDLFEQPDRTPITDRAFDAGKIASMNNQPRKPPHAPDTEAYRSWMAGYNNHQETLAGGFKAPPSRTEHQAAAGQTMPGDVAPATPELGADKLGPAEQTSGTPVSRKDFAATLAANAAAGNQLNKDFEAGKAAGE